MFTVSEEVFGIKYMYSKTDKQTHLMVLRKKKAGYELYCYSYPADLESTGSTKVTCTKCKKVSIDVPSNSESEEES